ncbi:DUF2924 domain-containing protein [Siculibacillus lacustris]|uniref:DUF2924 domain-containing protein n=2 Tax=Siculibacillus lacustris TaxID=1549641 RepID=A0A4Q9VJW1_9HYPH|nr:DUF2924 domain-containing protein [Siculibacillus lacustris]
MPHTLSTGSDSRPGALRRRPVPASDHRSSGGDVRADLSGPLAALTVMSRDDLVVEWRRQFRANPPDRVRRDLLELGIAWKLQEKALGGLKRAVATELRDLAEALATTGDIGRAKTLRLKPGARLIREWGGATHEVTVVETGFAWRGETWKSLSAIAVRITGAHWSGPRFFGLTSRGRTAAADGGETDGVTTATGSREEDIDA